MLFSINQTWPNLLATEGNAFLLSFFILVQEYNKVTVPQPRENIKKLIMKMGFSILL